MRQPCEFFVKSWCIIFKRNSLIFNTSSASISKIQVFFVDIVFECVNLCGKVYSAYQVTFILKNFLKNKETAQKNPNGLSIWNTMPFHAILWNFIVFPSLTHHSALFSTTLCPFNTNTNILNVAFLTWGLFLDRPYHDPMWPFSLEVFF